MDQTPVKQILGMILILPDGLVVIVKRLIKLLKIIMLESSIIIILGQPIISTSIGFKVI
jgi:hypothetical protein